MSRRAQENIVAGFVLAFFVAIIAYLPATLFLLIGLVAAYRSRRLPALRWGIAGLGLTFLAAAVQRLNIVAKPQPQAQSEAAQ